MKITTENLENCEVAISIEVEPERVQVEMQKAARRLAGRGRVPGYRKGKAPYHVISRFYGEEVIFEEMLDTLGQDAYREALDQSGIEPYDQGRLVDIQKDPLTIKLVVPVPPKVELCDYREVRKEFPKVEVTDKDVDEALERIREDQASWKPVDRPAQDKDMVSVTFKGEVDGREVFKEDEDFPLLIGKPYGEPLPGFGEKLVGAKAGNELDFSLDFPQNDPRKEHAGKPCHFRVRVQTVREMELPPLDDDLAKVVGDYENLAALRGKVSEAISDERSKQAKDQFSSDVLDTVIAQSTVKYPPVMLEEQLDGMVEDVERRIKREEQDLDSYLALSGQTREDFRASLKPRAERNLHRSLVLGEIVDKEKIGVKPEEFGEQFQKVEAAYERMGVEFDDRARNAVQRRLLVEMASEKAMDRLADVATGKAPPLTEGEPAPAESAEQPSAEQEAAS